MNETKKLELIKKLIYCAYDQIECDFVDRGYLLAIIDSINEIIFFKDNVANSNINE